MRISDWSSDVCSSDLDRLALGAVEDRIAMLLRQLLPWRFQPEAEMLRQARQHLHVIRRWRVGLRPWHHRSLLQRQRLAGNDKLRIEIELLTQSIAGRVRPLWRIEIGRASCRERVCQYVEITGVDVTLNKKKKTHCLKQHGQN